MTVIFFSYATGFISTMRPGPWIDLFPISTDFLWNIRRLITDDLTEAAPV